MTTIELRRPGFSGRTIRKAISGTDIWLTRNVAVDFPKIALVIPMEYVGTIPMHVVRTKSDLRALLDIACGISLTMPTRVTIPKKKQGIVNLEISNAPLARVLAFAIGRPSHGRFDVRIRAAEDDVIGFVFGDRPMRVMKEIFMKNRFVNFSAWYMMGRKRRAPEVLPAL